MIPPPCRWLAFVRPQPSDALSHHMDFSHSAESRFLPATAGPRFGAEKTQNRMGSRTEQQLHVGILPRGIAEHGAQALPTSPQPRRRRCRVQLRRADHRGRILHAASFARAHGASGGAGRFPERKSGTVGATGRFHGGTGSRNVLASRRTYRLTFVGH